MTVDHRHLDRDERASRRAARHLLDGGEHLPYDPWRQSLYSVEELAEGFDRGGYLASLDYRIYSWFETHRRLADGEPIREALAQRIHDHAIDEALEEVLRTERGRGAVGVMGGHGARRDEPCFASVTRLGWQLTRAGYLVATGGGPGIMEAANLGAWLSCFADPAVIQPVVEELSTAPVFNGSSPEGSDSWVAGIEDWLAAAHRVVERFGPGCTDADAARFRREHPFNGRSVAVPTWFYGHEPSNLFSTWIAKYFANSIREDGLLAIAKAGVVYAPGSAGTMQEIFIDLAQNHYGTCTVRSPMVFLGKPCWERLFGLVSDFVQGRGMAPVYGDLLHLTDDPLDAVAFIEGHPPRSLGPVPPLLPAR